MENTTTPTTTDTPRTDAERHPTCPHCGAEDYDPEDCDFLCDTRFYPKTNTFVQSRLCAERKKSQKLEADVERLRSTMRSFILVSPIEAQRMEKIEAEAERLRATMRSFIDFMDDNLGTTADWPMEAAFDDEETCQRHCDHLNAMKRLVKPEDIN